jgi:hypothetical protein
MERATGKSFAELVSTLFGKPMGAAVGSYITVDSDGSPRWRAMRHRRDFARVAEFRRCEQSEPLPGAG